MIELLSDPETWVAVAFVIFVGGLGYLGVHRMLTNALDNRAAKIKADLDEAARLREEAQRVLADYQRKQRDALKSAEEIVAHARAEAERVAQQAMRDLDAAIDIAVAAVRRMLADDLHATHNSALIDTAIADLPRQLN